MRKVGRKYITFLVKTHDRKGWHFDYYVNNGSITFKSEKMGNFFCTDNLIPRNELWFVRYVKDWIIKNNIHKKIKPQYTNLQKFRDTIKYYQYNSTLRTENKFMSKNLWEVDLSSAYWKTAFLLGIIDDKIYDMGLGIAKKTRLAALGVLAKSTDKFFYDIETKGIKYQHTTDSDNTKHLWFMVCDYISKVMNRAKLNIKDDFLFYWVDGIYMNSRESADKCVKIFKENGYDCTIEPVKEITFNADKKQLLVYGKGKRVKSCKVKGCTDDNPCRMCCTRKYPLVSTDAAKVRKAARKYRELRSKLDAEKKLVTVEKILKLCRQENISLKFRKEPKRIELKK